MATTTRRRNGAAETPPPPAPDVPQQREYDVPQVREHATIGLALAQAILDSGAVQKRGRNDHFGYAYATAADVAEVGRTALARNGLALIVTVPPDLMRVQDVERTGRNGKRVETQTDLVLECRLIHGPTAETITFHLPGSGVDSGEKSAYKALTGAHKYALRTLLMLPDNADPENDSGDRGDVAGRRHAAPAAAGRPAQSGVDERPASEAQVKRFFAIAAKAKMPDDYRLLLVRSLTRTADEPLGETDPAVLNRTQIDRAYQAIEAYGAGGAEQDRVVAYLAKVAAAASDAQRNPAPATQPADTGDAVADAVKAAFDATEEPADDAQAAADAAMFGGPTPIGDLADDDVPFGAPPLLPDDEHFSSDDDIPF